MKLVYKTEDKIFIHEYVFENVTIREDIFIFLKKGWWCGGGGGGVCTLFKN